MRVLIIEDQLDTVKDIIAHCEDNSWVSCIISFDDFETTLNEFNPDVIVLDWKEDTSQEDKGEPIIEKIWTSGYKPVIVFSALADTIVLPEKYKSSNLIRIQRKGDEAPVIEYLDSISPFVPVISGLKNDFNDALIQALNSIQMMSRTQPLSPNVMRYVFAKRVSTYFDKECSDESPPPWIQYTYPAITETLCVCDVIRSIPADGIVNTIGTEEEYKIILTPSCDIAQGNVSHALCANCYPKALFHKYPLCADPTTKQIDSIIINLNTGYKSSLVSLPNIPNVLPYLTIDLKKVELLPIEQIALQENKIVAKQHYYCRVASIDSPFSEQIVWAHMINSCRPGMPNRDMNLWAKELMLP